MAAFKKFGATLNDYMHLIMPKISALFDDLSIPVSVRKSAFECIDFLTEALDFSDYASLIIHPLVRSLGKKNTRSILQTTCFSFDHVFNVPRGHLFSRYYTRTASGGDGYSFRNRGPAREKVHHLHPDGQQSFGQASNIAPALRDPLRKGERRQFIQKSLVI